ncbi:hypothetical protein Sjap_010613 [Stephania japonica]|uniref:Uncharacterized protein n=1 Tax=Stephania japonica TaxID=461633 RepID=A0AAP0JBT4_9MAGN
METLSKSLDDTTSRQRVTVYKELVGKRVRVSEWYRIANRQWDRLGKRVECGTRCPE